MVARSSRGPKKREESRLIFPDCLFPVRFLGDDLHLVNHPPHPLQALRGLHGHSPLVIVLDLAGQGDVPSLAHHRDVAGRPKAAVLELLR